MEKRHVIQTILAIVAAAISSGCGGDPVSTSAAKESARLYRDVQGEEFFARYPIPHLSITIEGTNLTTLLTSSRTYVKATIREADQNWKDVGIHLKGSEGGSFRALDDKPAMTLNFDKFRKGQKFHGLDKVYLNNSVEDDRYMTEHLCGELFRQAGLPSPLVTHARIELNGRDRGLYVLKEGWDKIFLKRWFTNDSGNLYDSGLVFDVDEPLKKNSGDAETDQPDLAALVEATKEPDPAKRWQRMGAVLDLDRFLSFMAMEILTSHTDGYCLNRNNYRIYHDPGTGKLVFLPHGMDIMFSKPDLSITPPMTGLVARAVMEIPEGRTQYLARVGQLFTNVLSRTSIVERIDRLQTRIRPALADISADEALRHDRAVAGLRFAISQRLRAIARQLDGTEAAEVLTFDASGVARLPAWKPDSGFADHVLDEMTEGDKRTLHIRVTPGQVCVASWRTNVVLTPGQYLFQARVKCAGVTPTSDEKGTGVGIRLSGSETPRANQLVATTDWTMLTHEFTIQAEEASTEAELVCEMRATAGEVWFDRESLQLSKR